ncbi:TEK signal peptide protein [Ralstonia sp. SM1864_UCD524_TZ4]|uniref:Putative tek-related protein n=1 Tax=Ralstonia solanacearum TaxID=305 RepID=A0A0S4VNY4_RALSL|nr:TEK signal peptide protein [Ralstonia pseudosolanacearum]CUV24498.1 putative tek-related protein [Ralstonia solanacearum]MDO3507906.1 TEK signal peptide protein [Ralstonia pseudosolanacearum]MDO3512993.1 TEK signal peptide protein [Ralstonia pseudosolanacearum]MDO3630688.1 TEK signal peptide protein [Ralstonia pseudosolanacearum]CUV36139.1 putative tek-related protein [Ralstonia solanacearum]
MQARIKRNLVLSLAVAAASALAACGGGGGSDSGSSPSTGQVQGKAVDFYLSQANVVFTDCNNQATTTDSTGNFTFPSGCSKSAIKVSGGTDIGTGLAFGGVLLAPASDVAQGSTAVVTPFTTVLTQVGTDQSATLAAKLGVQSSNLLTQDPMLDVTMLKGAVVLQQLIEQIAKALAGLSASTGGSLTAEAAAAAAAKAVGTTVIGSSGSVDLTSTTLISNAVAAAVTNSEAALPSSVQASISAVAANVAALVTPLIASQVANVSAGLANATLGATPAATVAALQKAGALQALSDSAQSSGSSLLVSSVTAAALGNAALASSLAALGSAVALGDESAISSAAAALGNNVDGGGISSVISAVKPTDYLRIDSITMNGTAVPLSGAVTVNGSTLTEIKAGMTQVGQPFGNGASEIRAGLRYVYNGNEVIVVIEKVALTFSNNQLVAAQIPPGTAFQFVVNGTVNARVSISSTGDSLFDSGSGQLTLSIATFLNKLRSSGILSSAQIQALTPTAPGTANITLVIGSETGQPVRVRTVSGSGTRPTSVVGVDTGDSAVVGYGIQTSLTLVP